MNISFHLEYQGWVDISFQNEENELLIPGSFLTDFINDLMNQISTLAEGSNEALITVQTEPGEYRIQIIRENYDCRLTVYEYDDNFSIDNLEEGICVFEDSLKLNIFINMIYGEITKLRDLGNAEYSRVWGIEFPEHAYQRLIRAKEFINKKTNVVGSFNDE